MYGYDDKAKIVYMTAPGLYDEPTDFYISEWVGSHDTARELIAAANDAESARRECERLRYEMQMAVAILSGCDTVPDYDSRCRWGKEASDILKEALSGAALSGVSEAEPQPHKSEGETSDTEAPPECRCFGGEIARCPVHPGVAGEAPKLEVKG